MARAVAMAPARVLVLVATLTAALLAAPAPARAAWVDYPSSVTCGVTIPVDQCDPGDAAANSACRDMCHYSGCRRGGRCVPPGRLGAARGCYCQR